MSPPATRSRLRVLFVCSMNQWRSPTAEALYRHDARLDVRSAGVRLGARRTLTREDLEWADWVFVMEREHLRRIRESFPGLPLPRVSILEIPDQFRFMDPELQQLLRESIDPEMEAALSEGPDNAAPGGGTS
jgi:predicted protein tyrosine phosphatase